MSEVAVKEYIVRLSIEERGTLESLISKGKHSAAQLPKARILLKADVSDAGEGWSDSRIVKALDPVRRPSSARANRTHAERTLSSRI